ncbi:MAG: ATP-binding cassette domain-containing protein [Fimbriimonadaceae bacterium]|nr:ATP-binding cassette domain-containing protein [Fimbriimonadaceae bacterium]
MPAIETENLTKTYTTVRKQPGVWGSVRSLFRPDRVPVEAVKDVTFSVEQGEIVGFLGPNGAGKTTTLKMLTGILYETSGRASVLGFRPTERKPDMLRQIALVMGNKMSLWWDLPAWDSFLVLKELYDVDERRFKDRTERLVEALELTDKVRTQVRKLSLGERMKCELVAALLHSPRVIFLDEPTLGLDVVSQQKIRDFLKHLHRDEGCTIVLTSHYMQDVEELCKRVLVIDHGAKVFDGQLDDLSARFQRTKRLRLTFSEPVSDQTLAEFGRVETIEGTTAVVEVPKEAVPSTTAAVLAALPVVDIAIDDIAIEEVIRQLFREGKDGRSALQLP